MPWYRAIASRTARRNMVADRSRTFSPCNYTSDPETRAEETDLRCSRKSAVSCTSTRPTPGRRKSKTTPVRSLRFTQWLSTNTGLLFSIWCIMALCGGAAAAADRHHPSLEKLARRSGLLVDLSNWPEPPSLHRRNKGGDSSTSSISYAPIQASTVTLLSTGNPTTIATQSNPSPSALPQVYDSNIGNNFTSTTCPTFFEKLDTNSEFQECYPLSLLLTVSRRRINPLEKATNNLP